jgi:ABC-2 type transport system ATP-binding protein
LSANEARSRATQLLEEFSLTDAAHRPIKTFSGGMRRRLDLAASLIIHPKVLFLDEPTTGLDPRGRMEMWGVIEGLVKEGVTLLLTTQYLEEADQLADDIVVIDRGRVIAQGSSDQLKNQVGGERLEIVVSESDLTASQEIVNRISQGTSNIDLGLRKISVPVIDGTQSLISVIREFDATGIHALDLALKRPSLDDVFMALTGHAAEEVESESGVDGVDQAGTKKKGGRR